MNDMKSNELSKKGFVNWQPFKQDILNLAPKECGVYVIRLTSGRLCGRLKGESDILYIGSTTSKSGLKHRLRGYFSSSKANSTTNTRINSFINKYDMEISWHTMGLVTASSYKHKKAVTLEADLLFQYSEEHDELPPFNQSEVKRAFLFPDTPNENGVVIPCVIHTKRIHTKNNVEG